MESSDRKGSCQIRVSSERDNSSYNATASPVILTPAPGPRFRPGIKHQWLFGWYDEIAKGKQQQGQEVSQAFAKPEPEAVHRLSGKDTGESCRWQQYSQNAPQQC